MIENKIKLCEKKICINLKYPDKMDFIMCIGNNFLVLDFSFGFSTEER